ncbi:recombinase family protein [Serratia marcescens]|uniref:recombinase family protein n=1 Tax=Serratia marcescens TaxID=615 RepID=UPI003FA6D1DB
MIAYSYVRFSTKVQATGTSLERQLKASKEFCLKHGLELSTRGYHDLGISGYKSVRRPELEQMLEAIKTNEIKSGSYILIEAIDRLSRKGISHTQDVLKAILSHDVNVAFVGEDSKTLMNTVLTKDSLNDLSAVILVALAADLAYKESLRKSKLVKAAKAIARDKIKNGAVLPSRVSFWLTYDQNKYVFNDKLSIIKTIISMRQNGRGYRTIATHLNVQGILSPTGKKWTHSSIVVILNNPTLYGAYQTAQMINGQLVPDTLVKNYFPALISYEEFILLKGDGNNSAKGAKPTDNPFAGLIKCQCGSPMRLRVRRNKSSEYQYYFCLASTEGRCNQKRTIRGLTDVLFQVMDKLEIKSIGRKTIKQSEIKALDMKIIQLNNMLLQLDSPPLSVMQSISDLEKKKHMLLNNDVPEIKSNDVKRLATINDILEYNMLLKRLVERIVIHKTDTKNNSYRVEVFKTDRQKQNFLIQDGRILFKSDTKLLVELLKSFKEDITPLVSL